MAMWFEGDIADAVTKAKTDNACLVVFIEGTNEASQRLESWLNADKITKYLNTRQFVCVKFQQETEAYKNFAALYKLVPVPSVFFLGVNGKPLDIVTVLVESIELVEQKIAKIVDTLANQSTEPAAATSGASTSQEGIKGAESENVEREMREKDLREMREKLRRDKLIEQGARERVRAQIAADRKERADMQNAAQRRAEPAKEKTVTPPPEDASVELGKENRVRLQFRMANGNKVTHNFETTTTLSVVRDFVRNELLSSTRNSGNFVLATTYPKRDLTADCDVKTLVDLGLAPNAAILVIVADSSNNPGAMRRHFDSVWRVTSVVFLALMSPFVSMANYVGSLIGWQGGAATAAAQAKKTDNNFAMSRGRLVADKKDTAAATENPNSDVVKRRWVGESNVHRLSDRRDDDEDDNATWNGNSTQQQ